MTRHLGKCIAAAAIAVVGTMARAQPANDSCANAIPVANNSSTPFDTTGATRDGEVACSNFGTDVDVWFSYVAAGPEWVTIDTCASPYNAALANSFGVRLGVFASCGGTMLGCTDAGNCGTPYIGSGYRHTRMTFTTTGAGTYLICVKGFQGSLGPGVLTLQATPVATPANNDCINATPVVDGDNTIDNRNATLDTPCPCTRGGPSFAGPDVWYSYTATQTGVRNFTITQALRTSGASGDTILAIYSGCGGTLLACDDDANSSSLSKVYHFPVTAGTEYKIQVATWGTQSFRQAFGVLNISAPPVPQPFDDCSLATPVAGQVTVPFSTVGLANFDRRGTDCAPYLKDGWFAWTPSVSGIGVVEACDAGGVNNANGLLISIYDSCSAAPLLCAQGPNDSPNEFCQPKICLDVSAGQTYYVRFGVLFGWQEATGDLHFTVRPPNAGISIPTSAVVAEPGSCTDLPSGDLNGGCNVTPNVLTPIQLCGTYTGTASSRLDPLVTLTSPYTLTVDSDWYEFTLETDDFVTITGESEFSPSGGIRSAACPGTSLRSTPAVAGRCDGIYSLNLRSNLLLAGTYYYVVSPRQGSGVADGTCGHNDRYWFTIVPDSGCPGACCTGTACSIGSQSACTGSFQGANTTCGATGNPTTCCSANFNGSGGVTVQDIFDFLAAYFGSQASADFNRSGSVSVQDIFDFLAAYFLGC